MIADSDTLGAEITQRFRMDPDNVVIVDSEARLRASDILLQTAEIAERLLAIGCRPNEPVVVQIAGTVNDIVLLISVWLAKAVPIPIHAIAKKQTISSIIRISNSRFFLQNCPIAPGEELVDFTVEEILSNGVSLKYQSSGAEIPPILRGAALVVFTSGTTGSPKGVVQSHQGYLGRLRAVQEVYGVPRQMKTLIYLPLSFSFGQWTSFYTLSRGGQITLRRKFDSLEAQHLLNAERYDWMPVVPTMLRKLTKNQSKTLVGPSLFLAGGEPLEAALAERTLARYPTSQLTDVYGLTETNSADFIVTPKEMNDAMGTIGRPSPNVEFRIKADAGSGDVGELQIKTPFVMRGYLGDVERTQKAFDGTYLRTGDLVRQLPSGYVQIVGRTNDIINRGGNKISPIEVEEAILRHGSVAQTLVAGLPCDDKGHKICALVVPNESGKSEIGNLREWLKGSLESYKIPDAILAVESLPTTDNGKLSRAKVASYFQVNPPEG